MAEIHIEKKRKLSPLIWLILLVLLAVASWFFYRNYMISSPTNTVPAATTSTLRPSSPLGGAGGEA